MFFIKLDEHFDTYLENIKDNNSIFNNNLGNIKKHLPLKIKRLTHSSNMK